MSSSPGNYAAMTIAELRSILTRNGVKVPQSSIKKAVLHVFEGVGSGRFKKRIFYGESATTNAVELWRKESRRGSSKGDRGSRVSKSSRVGRESTSRPTTNSRGSAVTRRSSRARTSISSAVDSEGTDLVDVARMFSSDEEEMSDSMGYLPGPRPIYCDDITKEDCEPCPPNAECRGRSMVCKPLFKRDGDVCVRDERL
ncbi:hypothetical protein Pmar_PMAR019338 [Perkinsus marinus ATCC 50983]|uniref:Uncharacterized protein n=1 Tax=Perkinsus marinus (strain ATCC 50983 / TXsc) TaxID=423536 RepID=C5KFV5_PERM5|nr:hypothetical protein Pmar_PMAR019338 [Perkinsus marinus ATCC 50983]EER16657.1 hypothetical protein Pmar_PMAR019338 [Perkinsus marinus ATCC 50983]|eukprot:XP_002784861.1 hypothetical protein Pmar_PMAR019338 [Perkinsus marinus ATCC 50983]